ncbi:MAG: PKD domain-containing protein [Woeseiaceae bacterium]|nr:PKD domain-containing protein [Woeseiaceae bacterium]
MRACSFILFCICLLSAPVIAQVYQYDPAGRVTRATWGDGSSIDYEYDVNSNITRIAFAPAAPTPQPPDGVIDTPADDVSIETGQSIDFTGTAADPDGAVPLTFLWDFDGGAANSNDEDPGPVTFNTAGIFTIEFIVTDATNLGDPTPDSVLVTVTNPAPPPGGGGAGGESGGGGGSVFLLPFLLAVFTLRRIRKGLLLTVLLACGSVNAQSWIEQNSGTDQNLNDVWMASADLAYAVGDAGTVIRYDGNVWSPVDVGTTVQLNAVWGTAPDNVWIAGMSGTVLHFDGSAWSAISIGAGTLPLNDVWTAGPGAPVYVVGGRGAWRLEGGSWSRVAVQAGTVSLEPPHNMTAIRGSDNYVVMTANDAFGLSAGIFVNFSWVALDTASTNSVWVHDDTFMLAIGEARRLMNGGDPEGRSTADWQIYSEAPAGNAVWGTDPQSIWIAGATGTSGRIHFFDGTLGATTDRRLSRISWPARCRQPEPGCRRHARRYLPVLRTPAGSDIGRDTVRGVHGEQHQYVQR